MLPLHKWTVCLVFSVLTAALFVLFSFLNTLHPVGHQVPDLAGLDSKKSLVLKNHAATDKLIEKLKQYGLWKIDTSRKVPRFFIKSYPPDLHAVNDISLKKKVFLHALLPHALFVREEALRKRSRLESILSKISCSDGDINFGIDPEFADACSWDQFLDTEEVDFIQDLTRIYRTDTALGLLERVDAVPTSIILAQGALESSWGSSRFTREGNSIFGMWTWKHKGIIPLRREEGKTHKVKIYDSVLDSVQAYHLTLNRLDSYEQFRQFRKATDDPLIMAEGLIPYSERGKDYVEEIKKVIRFNDLQKYDNFNLSDLELPKLTSSLSQNSSPVITDKTSL